MNALNPITYPSSADLRREFAAERIADDDIARARRMRTLLTQARADIAAMQFATVFPVTGWDLASVLGMIDDITPACDAGMEKAMLDTAYENLGGVVL